MAKNILLLFLSDVKTKKLDDGSFVISEAHYTNIDGENTQTTNESAIRYLLKTIRLDIIFIVASKKFTTTSQIILTRTASRNLI